MTLRRLLSFVVAVAMVALLIAGARYGQHWLSIHLGIGNETSVYYAFWSGFGSDLGEATLIVGVGSLLRHHNCHHPRCLFLGRPIDGVDHLVACWRHHPAHEHGGKRSVRADEMRRLYHLARQNGRSTQSLEGNE